MPPVSFALQSAATAVAVAPALPIGAWLGLIATGLTLAGVIYRSGVNSAETRHTKEMAEGELKRVNATLEEIAAFMKDSQREDIVWAQWRGDMSTRMETVETEVDVAKEEAHRARNVAQEAITHADQLDARVVRLEREEERRTGPADRRHLT